MKRNNTSDLLVGLGLLGVVVILCGISGIDEYLPLPTYGRSKGDINLLTTNLQSTRAQLELYRLHHNGNYPTDIIVQLTKKTDADGTVNAAGAYGPYMQAFPANSFVADPVEAIKVSGAPGEGWFYDPATGVFRANTLEHKGL